jgi:calmodulin
MDTLGIVASPEEIDLMINEIDQDSNGEIDFEEFVAVMSRKVNATYTADEVKNAFKAFEGKSNPGFIKADKLLLALTTYGSDKISMEQAKELINQLEPDLSGDINYVEYVNMMMAE